MSNEEHRVTDPEILKLHLKIMEMDKGVKLTFFISSDLHRIGFYIVVYCKLGSQLCACPVVTSAYYHHTFQSLFDIVHQIQSNVVKETKS